MQKNLKRLKFNYVAVKVLDDDRMTPGGIFKPETTEEDIKFGRVVSVGPGRYEYGKFVETCVVPGDLVFFSRHSSGITFKDPVGDLIIFRDSEIYGTVEE